MAHDKIFGICENKCLVEAETKEDADAVRERVGTLETDVSGFESRIDAVEEVTNIIEVDENQNVTFPAGVTVKGNVTANLAFDYIGFNGVITNTATDIIYATGVANSVSLSEDSTNPTTFVVPAPIYEYKSLPLKISDAKYFVNAEGDVTIPTTRTLRIQNHSDGSTFTLYIKKSSESTYQTYKPSSESSLYMTVDVGESYQAYFVKNFYTNVASFTFTALPTLYLTYKTL